MKEEFRPVPDTNGDYEVSNMGNVRSYKIKLDRETNTRIRVAKPMRTFKASGHTAFTMSINGKTMNKYVDRLVLELFGEPIAIKSKIRHKDGNLSNNCIDNLEYIVTQEMLDAKAEQVSQNKNGCKKLIYEFDYTGKLVDIWDSAAQIAAAYHKSEDTYRIAAHTHLMQQAGLFYSYEPTNNILRYPNGVTKKSWISDCVRDHRVDDEGDGLIAPWTPEYREKYPHVYLCNEMMIELLHKHLSTPKVNKKPTTVDDLLEDLKNLADGGATTMDFGSSTQLNDIIKAIDETPGCATAEEIDYNKIIERLENNKK